MVPLERWDVDGFAARLGTALGTRFGGFVPGADLFDSAAFGISRSEAGAWQACAWSRWAMVARSCVHALLLFTPAVEFMDPQQRLLLEHTGEVLHQGVCPSSTGKPGGEAAERTAVMVGVATADYTGALPVRVRDEGAPFSHCLSLTACLPRRHDQPAGHGALLCNRQR